MLLGRESKVVDPSSAIAPSSHSSIRFTNDPLSTSSAASASHDVKKPYMVVRLYKLPIKLVSTCRLAESFNVGPLGTGPYHPHHTHPSHQSLAQAQEHIGFIDVRVDYALTASLQFKMSVSIDTTNLVVPLPRVGLQLCLDRKVYNNVTWYGQGPHECYPDRRESALKMLHSAPISSLYVPYLVPSENANRTNVDWILLDHNQHLPTYLCQQQQITSHQQHDNPLMLHSVNYNQMGIMGSSEPRKHVSHTSDHHTPPPTATAVLPSPQTTALMSFFDLHSPRPKSPPRSLSPSRLSVHKEHANETDETDQVHFVEVIEDAPLSLSLSGLNNTTAKQASSLTHSVLKSASATPRSLINRKTDNWDISPCQSPDTRKKEKDVLAISKSTSTTTAGSVPLLSVSSASDSDNYSSNVSTHLMKETTATFHANSPTKNMNANTNSALTNVTNNHPLALDQTPKLRISSPTPFNFSAQYYTTEDLEQMSHSVMLEHFQRSWVSMNIDPFLMGVGGDDSWTACLHDEYLVKPQGYSYELFFDFYSS